MKKYWYLVPAVLLGILEGFLAHDVRIGIASVILIGFFLFLKLPQRFYEHGVVQAVVFWGSPLFYFVVTEILNLHFPWNTYLVPLVLNYILYALFALFFSGIFGNWLIGLYVSSFFSFLLGGVNYFVRVYKNSAFSLYDILSVRTLYNVLDGGMELTTDWVFAAGLLLYILYWIILSKFIGAKKKVPHKKAGVVLRVFAIAALPVFMLGIFNGKLLQKAGVDTTIYHASEKNGFMVHLFASYVDSLQEAPEGYSPEKLDELKALYEQKNVRPETMPNVIVVMNESFSDLSCFGDFETDVPVMENIDALSENTIKGYALSSVFGGNTANSEWEFLTGNTMYFMPTGCVPYQMYVTPTAPSLAKTLSGYGYHCVAFHPYESSGWKRKSSWKDLGFAQTFFLDDYKESNRQTLINKKMTDKANYQEILDYLDQADKSVPQFVFNVTIQNHTGGFLDAQNQLGYRIHITDGVEGKYDYVEGYLTMMHESDAAFAYLISELEKKEEPYIVLMFGDHQAALGTDNAFLSEIYGKNVDSFSEEENEYFYRVPYVIWANYDLDETAVEGITGLNYLQNILLDKMGLSGSAYNTFLDQCREVYPAINAFGYYDRDGKFHSIHENGETDSLLKDYHYLQYNNIFDHVNYRKDFFERH